MDIYYLVPFALAIIVMGCVVFMMSGKRNRITEEVPVEEE